MAKVNHVFGDNTFSAKKCSKRDHNLGHCVPLSQSQEVQVHGHSDQRALACRLQQEHIAWQIAQKAAAAVVVVVVVMPPRVITNYY
jgi:hypothetical protein